MIGWEEGTCVKWDGIRNLNSVSQSEKPGELLCCLVKSVCWKTNQGIIVDATNKIDSGDML